MDYKEKIIKKSVELWVINDDVEWEDFCKFKEYIRSLPPEKEIAKGVMKKYFSEQIKNNHNKAFWKAQKRITMDWLDKESE